jgi:hypothetical protein
MASNEHLDKIKEKLAKMLAKEESAREIGNQAEAEAFAAKIQQMLMEYELSMDDLKKKSAESVHIDRERLDTASLTGPHESNWVVYLYHACCKTNFCSVLVRSASSTEISIIGTDMNREFLHFMVHQLVPRVRQLAKKSWSEYDGPEKRNTYIRGFLRGCCKGIQSKLALDLMGQQRAAEQVNALVVQKDRAVQMWIQQNIGRTGTIRARGMSGRGGYENGMEAGRNININKGISGNKGMGGQNLLN